MNKKVSLVVVLVLAVGAALAAMKPWAERKSRYRPVAVSRGSIEVIITATGVVQSENRLELKPPIAGRVEKMLIEEGQKVRRGQVVAWMSSTERAAMLDAARAKGPEELAKWEELYRATPLIAPINGVVILRNVESGQTVTTADAVLVMSDRLLVKAQVDETDIAQVQLRQPAEVSLDAYPDRPMEARVEHIAYDAKTVSNVTTYTVDVLPQAVPTFMKSGMTANVRFQVAKKEAVLLLPAETIHQREGKASVLVGDPTADAAPQPKQVEVGLSDGKRVEIVSGLSEGDKVLDTVLDTARGKQEKSLFAPMNTGGRGSGLGGAGGGHRGG